MIIPVSDFEDSPFSHLGFELALVLYVKNNGDITSLDRFAHDKGIDPGWMRRCAHAAEAKGLLKLTRLSNASGRPYRVSALEEETHEN
jgi:hypothetical protein